MVISKIFVGLVEPYISYFDTLSLNLKKARIKTPVEEYLSIVIFVTILVLVLSMILGSVFITLFFPPEPTTAAYTYTLSIILSLLIKKKKFAGLQLH